MSETITILPQSNDTVLCVRLTGMVSAAEYAKKFGAAVEKMAENHKNFNLLVFYDEDFEGWSPEAADLSFKNFSQFSPHAHKLAYVNAPETRMLMMKMMKPMTSNAQVRYFDKSALVEALEWVCAR